MSAQQVSPVRVLVIDDEPQIRRFLDISLRAQGYAVVLAGDANAGLATLAGGDVDLVVLDMGLPDRDGLDVLRDMRGWSTVPVIVLTVRSGEGEKVAALDAGANDYVTKPFGVPELMARIRAVLRARATPADAPAVYQHAGLRIDLARREVALDGIPIPLSRKEYALLALLAQHAGRVATQPHLLRELWGPTHQTDTHYLRILVGKLRQKLGEDAAAPRWLVTEPGVGLRLIDP
jgi:two-component system KDP operon response regulator KdpE